MDGRESRKQVVIADTNYLIGAIGLSRLPESAPSFCQADDWKRFYFGVDSTIVECDSRDSQDYRPSATTETLAECMILHQAG